MQTREFQTEVELVQQFLSHLAVGDSPWGEVVVATEWDYRTGIVDVLARDSDGTILAFEAKLENWRRASHQAYRTTTFARKSFVILPACAADRAMQHENYFASRGIGLCTIHSDCITILLESAPKSPLMPWLTDRAHTYLDSYSGESSERPGASRALCMC